MTETMVYKKETKNTYVYEGGELIPTLYIRKNELAKSIAGVPTKLIITIEAE